MGKLIEEYQFKFYEHISQTDVSDLGGSTEYSN